MSRVKVAEIQEKDSSGVDVLNGSGSNIATISDSGVSTVLIQHDLSIGTATIPSTKGSILAGPLISTGTLTVAGTLVII